MDRLLDGIINDYTLYRISEGIIAILILAAVYLGVQIALALKFIKKKEASSSEAISQRKSLNRSTIFIFITGFFMLAHELLEGLKSNIADYATYELLELVAFMGLVSFLYEWHKALKRLRKNDVDPVLSKLS